MKQPGRQYLKVMVGTATPLANIIALYEKCLFHLDRAGEYLAAGEVDLKTVHLRKAMDILFYLDGVIASEGEDQEAALALHQSYRLILGRLIRAGSENYPDDLAMAGKWLGELLEAWQGITPQGGRKPPKSSP